MASRFKILITSDIEYNDLCAEFFFDDQFIGIVTQEQGIENLQIEIYSPFNQNKWSFKFSEFEDILESAKNTLRDMKKSSQDNI